MTRFERHILGNGLTVLLHEDESTPMVTVNMLCNVGARDENENRTGFAHLFEHLMFGGTPRVPDYDNVVTGMGGEANAFTNNDYTNYYVTVPAQYMEQALELEADRLRGLDFSERPLEVQRKVVTEEYQQRYVNQPYGDTWMLLRPLCYKRSPYRWCTIGADIRHVQEASLEEVREFFYRYYRPENVILGVAGNLRTGEALRLVERHFGGIERGWESLAGPHARRRQYERELPQTEARRQEVWREVPSDAIYKAYGMCDRFGKDYVVYDLISDVLSNGKSSRMYNELVKEQRLFSEVSAFISGECGEGLFVVKGQLNEGVAMAEAEAAIDEELRRMKEERLKERELEKVVNKYEATYEFTKYRVADRVQMLCHNEWLGMPELTDDEPKAYRKVKAEDMQRVSEECFREERSNTLYYRKKGTKDGR